MHPYFMAGKYLLKKQVLAFTGKFRILDPNGVQLMYSEQKMFKLREDIRVYTDENKTFELLYIQARQILDFSAAYDVYDQTERCKVGVLRRKGWQSIARDEWEILDAYDRPFATLIEDSLGLALVRRLLMGSLIPQDYNILAANGSQLADLKQRFKFFGYELDIDMTFGYPNGIDPRLGIAAGILLSAIEGKQSS